jgi:hypothetical protein
VYSVGRLQHMLAVCISGGKSKPREYFFVYFGSQGVSKVGRIYPLDIKLYMDNTSRASSYIVNSSLVSITNYVMASLTSIR